MTAAASSHLHHKRQTNSDEEVCVTAMLTNRCTSGYYEAYAYLLAKCNVNETARSLQDTCRRHSRGYFCGSSLYPFNISRGACGNSSITTCPTECRNLLNTARAQLGCSVSVYNNSDYITHSYFSYSQRSLYGVEPVTEECAPSSFGMLPGVDPNCTEESLYSDVFCRTNFWQSYYNTLQATPACNITEKSETLTADICGVNEDGHYCQTLLHDTESRTNCRNESICDSLCIGAINNLNATFGCCLNSVLNRTSGQRDWLSYDFWQRCGLTSISGAVLRAPVKTTVTVLAVAVLVYSATDQST